MLPHARSRVQSAHPQLHLARPPACSRVCQTKHWPAHTAACMLAQGGPQQECAALTSMAAAASVALLLRRLLGGQTLKSNTFNQKRVAAPAGLPTMPIGYFSLLKPLTPICLAWLCLECEKWQTIVRCLVQSGRAGGVRRISNLGQAFATLRDKQPAPPAKPAAMSVVLQRWTKRFAGAMLKDVQAAVTGWGGVLVRPLSTAGGGCSGAHSPWQRHQGEPAHLGGTAAGAASAAPGGELQDWGHLYSLHATELQQHHYLQAAAAGNGQSPGGGSGQTVAPLEVSPAATAAPLLQLAIAQLG